MNKCTKPVEGSSPRVSCLRYLFFALEPLLKLSVRFPRAYHKKTRVPQFPTPSALSSFTYFKSGSTFPGREHRKREGDFLEGLLFSGAVFKIRTPQNQHTHNFRCHTGRRSFVGGRNTSARAPPSGPRAPRTSAFCFCLGRKASPPEGSGF